MHRCSKATKGIPVALPSNGRQSRIDAWWTERERRYRLRPKVLHQIEQLRAESQQRLDAESTLLERLEARAAAGIPGAERALSEAYTWSALQNDPPEPAAKDDPAEWRAFFRHEYGRDMPLNAAYQAERHRIEAAAPADVGGMAAEYFEARYPSGYDPAELAAERHGPLAGDRGADWQAGR